MHELLEVIHAERHVARFVTGHEVNDILQHRVGSCLTRCIEGRQRQTLDHDLHADKFQVPSWVRENFVDDAIEMSVNRIHQSDTLLDVLIKDLNVSGLVKRLRCRIQLRIEGWRAGTELTRNQQGPLFSV